MREYKIFFYTYEKKSFKFLGMSTAQIEAKNQDEAEINLLNLKRFSETIIVIRHTEFIPL
jgi:hypothetical protein